MDGINGACDLPHTCDGRILVLPPEAISPAGYNVGDRATQIACVSYLREKCHGYAGRVDILERSSNYTPIWQGLADSPKPGDIGISQIAIGGDGLSELNSRHAELLAGASAVLFLTTDVLDGRYDHGLNYREVTYAQFAGSASPCTTISVTSFEYGKPLDSALPQFPSRTCFRPRSPESFSVVTKVLNPTISMTGEGSCTDTLAPSKVEASRDVVFMLQSSLGVATTIKASLLHQEKRQRPNWVEHTIRWLDQVRSTNRTVIGVNLFIYKEALPSSTTLDFIARHFGHELCVASRKEPLAIIFVPHDFRPERYAGTPYKTETEYLVDVKRSMEGCDPSIPAVIMNDGAVYEPVDSKAITLHLDLVVSGFMHFLIIASGAKTPAVALRGQEKHAHLVQMLYGQPLGAKAIISPGEALGKTVFANFVLRSLANAPLFRSALEETIPSIAKDAQKNFNCVVARKACSSNRDANEHRVLRHDDLSISSRATAVWNVVHNSGRPISVIDRLLLETIQQHVNDLSLMFAMHQNDIVKILRAPQANVHTGQVDGSSEGLLLETTRRDPIQRDRTPVFLYNPSALADDMEENYLIRASPYSYCTAPREFSSCGPLQFCSASLGQLSTQADRIGILLRDGASHAAREQLLIWMRGRRLMGTISNAEDGRLFRFSNGSLHALFTRGEFAQNPPMYSMILARLEPAYQEIQLHYKRPGATGFSRERNWIPLVEVSDRLLFSYELCPDHVVIECNHNSGFCWTKHHSPSTGCPTGRKLRGGSAPLRFANFLLSVAHFYETPDDTKNITPYERVVDRRYGHVFCLMQSVPPFRVLRVSGPFVLPSFFGTSMDQIQFCSALTWQNYSNPKSKAATKAIRLWYGVADCTAQFFDIPLTDVWRRLHFNMSLHAKSFPSSSK